MGAHEVLFAVDASLVENPRQDIRRAVQALETLDHHTMRDVALCLGKDGYVLEGVLALYGIPSAVSGAHGIEVSENELYRPTCLLMPEQVKTMHQALAALDVRLVPMPSEDGYVDDERLETNATLRTVARQLEMLGFHATNFRQMEELTRMMDALRAFYARAASRSEAVVCLVM